MLPRCSIREIMAKLEDSNNVCKNKYTVNFQPKCSFRTCKRIGAPITDILHLSNAVFIFVCDENLNIFCENFLLKGYLSYMHGLKVYLLNLG